jgi:hypothetical protein
MTPKEKAIEMFHKYYGIPLYVKTVKQCCCIAVDEILVIMNEEYFSDSHKIEYWEQVKIEINKL